MCAAFSDGRPVESPTATFQEWITAIVDGKSGRAHPSGAWVGKSVLPKDEEWDSKRS